MSAPAPVVHAATLPLEAIVASLTNPRKHFGEQAIAELAESIRTHGVMQPILVRPLPATRTEAPGVLYEIVAGERRWRASKAAGLAEIPGFWRELTDQEVLELQIIENLQREGLHPLEEAEGYERLMHTHGYTAEALGAKVGKSKAYIYGRMKLCSLCQKAREAFYAGRLNPSTALLVARIPVVALQEQATEEITDNWGGFEPMSFRDAAHHVQARYMLRLAEAPFPRGDADLVPTAGKCSDCPKRTGNQPQLFEDVKSADVCTDPECFAAKRAAHAERQRQKAAAEGRKIIEGAEAKKIKPHDYTHELNGDYVDLSKKCYEDPKHRTYAELLGKKAPPAELLVDPHQPDHVIEVLPRATIKEHLEAKGIKVPDAIQRGKSDTEKKVEAKRKADATFRQRLFEQIRSRLLLDTDGTDGALQPHEVALVAGAFFARLDFEGEKRLARLWMGPQDAKQDDHALIREFRDRIPSLSLADHTKLLIDCALVGEVPTPAWSDKKPERMLVMAGHLHIDPDAIKKEILAETRAKEKGKAKKPAPKKSAAAKVQPQTATPSDGELQIGDPVRIRNGLKGPGGKYRKCCGKTGTIEAYDGTFYTVRTGPRAHELIANLVWNEIDKLPAAPAETASPPTPAAQARDVDAAEAAPADDKAAPKPKKGGTKKAAGKANPAPAAPANEPAAPVEDPVPASPSDWPYPAGGFERKEEESAPAAPAEEGGASAPADRYTNSTWPFPTGRRT